MNAQRDADDLGDGHVVVADQPVQDSGNLIQRIESIREELRNWREAHQLEPLCRLRGFDFTQRECVVANNYWASQV
jgi:hypothetical protein